MSQVFSQIGEAAFETAFETGAQVASQGATAAVEGAATAAADTAISAVEAATPPLIDAPLASVDVAAPALDTISDPAVVPSPDLNFNPDLPNSELPLPETPDLPTQPELDSPPLPEGQDTPQIKEPSVLKSEDPIKEIEQKAKTDAELPPDKNNKEEPEQNEAQEQNDPSQKKIQAMDKKIQDTLNDFFKGYINKNEWDKRLKEDEKERQDLVDKLVDEKKENKRPLTKFEKEVAQKGSEVRDLIQEIAVAPKHVDAMTTKLQKLKSKFKEVSSFKINNANADTKEAQHNALMREYLGNAIADQASQIAYYKDKTRNNVNEFIDKNSKLEELVGARSILYHAIVKLGTSIVRQINAANIDSQARFIAKNA